MTKATPSFWQSSVPPEQRKSTGYCNELIQLAQFYKDANKNKSLIYQQNKEYEAGGQALVKTLFKNDTVLKIYILFFLLPYFCLICGVGGMRR